MSSASIAKPLPIEKAVHDQRVSDHGSVIDLRHVGTNPITSIVEAIIIARRGLSSCHHTKIAAIAAISITVSLRIIFLVPYLREKRNTIATKNTPIVSANAPKPPPTYQMQATAVH